MDILLVDEVCPTKIPHRSCSIDTILADPLVRSEELWYLGAKTLDSFCFEVNLNWMLLRFMVSAHSKNLCCRYDAVCWNASRAKAEAPIWAEQHNCAGDKSKINATLHSKMQINLFQLSSKRRLGFSGLNNSCSCEERLFFLWAYLKPRTSSEQVIHSPQFKAVPYLLVWERKKPNTSGDLNPGLHIFIPTCQLLLLSRRKNEGWV